MRLSVHALLLAGLLIAACGEPDGGMYAGWAVYEAPSGAYRLRYLDPPWILDESRGSDASFYITSTAERLMPGSGAPHSYELDVTVRTGVAARLAPREARRARARDEEVLIEPRDVETEVGDTGMELMTRGTGGDRNRYYRYVFLDRPAGGCVYLRFEANPVLDEPEVDAMVASVEVDPPLEMP